MRTFNQAAILLLATCISASSIAQTTASKRTSPTNSSTTPATTAPPANKVDKKLNEVSQGMNSATNTLDNATATTDKAKKTLEGFSKLFKPKTANEALIIIPDIEFDDENLEKLLEAVKDHKDVKKASLDYTDGVATINTILKNKASTDFWTEIPKDIKAHFKMKSKNENSLLVAYQKNQETPAH